MRVKLLVLALGLTGALAIPASAQRGWTLLGEREVNDRVDRDTIAARGGRRFSEVRLCVQHHAVRIYDMDVRFRNGGNQDVPVRAIIPAGGCTRDIALRGRGGRDITTVAFTYEAASLGRARAHVRLFGR